MLRLLATALLTLLAFAAHAQTIGISGDATLRIVTQSTTSLTTGPLPITGTIPSDPDCPASGSVTVSIDAVGGITAEVSGFVQQVGLDCDLTWSLQPAGGASDLMLDLVVPSSPFPIVPVKFTLETSTFPGVPAETVYNASIGQQGEAMRGVSEVVKLPDLNNLPFLTLQKTDSRPAIFRASVLAIFEREDQLALPLGVFQGEYFTRPPEPPLVLNETIIFSATAVPGSIGSSVASLGGWGLATLVLGIVIGVQLRVRRR